jgi:hypothetical protein
VGNSRCDAYNSCAITSATISPDETKVATHDKLFYLNIFQGDNFQRQNNIRIRSFFPKESGCFTDNDRMFIADERTKVWEEMFMMLP